MGEEVKALSLNDNCMLGMEPEMKFFDASFICGGLQYYFGKSL